MKRKHRNIGDRVQLIVDEVLHLLGHSSRSSADAARGRVLQLTRLEERMLMSASPMAMIAEVAMVAVESSPVADAVDAGTNTTAVTENSQYTSPDAQGPDSQVADSEPSTDTTAEVRGVELVVIDSRVQDADALLASLLSDNRDVRLLRLDAHENGLTQITEKLEQLGNVSAIHLLSHGREGEILLGSTVLNADTLTLCAPELLAWQHSLTANADLLLYSCDLAESPEGKDFIASLSQLTAADVAASTDATGSQSFGGDWELEYQSGAIETHVFGNSSMIGDWNDLLGVITVSTTNDVLDGDTSSVAALLGSRGTDGVISLREAIIATNNTAGADTIFLTAGTFTFSIGGQGENAAFSGDLDILDSLTITGAGSGLSTINAGSLDRVFELRGAITATFEDVTIRGGSMPSNDWGGGVLTDNGSTLNLSRVVVTGNSIGSGAGIYNYGTMVATDTIINNNTASDWGGGLYNDRGNVTLNRVTMSGNAAGKDGGGIENAGSGASMSLTNVTLSGNTATGNGGGLWTSQSLTATNVTIAFNDAASGDGIFMQGGGADVLLRNSVLYNTSGVNANRAVNSLGNNIDSGFTAGLTGPGDQSGINPLLDATLQNNGGFVTTHRLLSGSSAIDTGSTVSAPTVDARNTARDGAPDIGAYEVQELLTSRAESLVNTATTNTQSTSSESRGSTHAVAAARDGSHVIVWSSLNQDGGGWGVYGQRFDAAGNKVGVEFLINETTTNDQKHATVAMNGRGDFVVSWTSVSQDGSGNGVYARRYDAAGTALGSEFRVGMTSTGDQDSPVVAMAADGRFLIVWEGQGAGDTDGIFGRWYAANGAPSGSEILINTTTAGVQEDPSVSMAPDGTAVVFWTDSTNGVRAQRFDETGTFAGTEINVENMSSAEAPDVEMAADGSFVVAYRQTLLDLGIYFRRFDATGTPLGPFAQLANSTPLGDQTDPSITMDDTGNFLIVWEGNGTGDTDGVFGRRYTDSGTALNSFEFRINGTTTGTQSMASAAMLTGGSFVVAWSGAAAADSSGVYTRQFANTPPTITTIANQTIPENGATAALSFTIGDAESSSSTLVVTASSSNPALVSPSGFVFTGFGSNRTIMVTPNANQAGTATITVTVDDSSTTTSTSFLLTVTQGNNAPVITSNGGGGSATLSVAENETAVTTVTATDSDLPAQTLTYSINGGSDASLFAINSTTGVLTFLASPNYESPVDSGTNNDYHVNVMVSDGTLTDIQPLTVTVTDANESPVITSNGGGASASISVAENTTTVTTVTSTDPDLPAQTRTYSISGGADAAKFTINSSTGVLSFAVAPNFEAPTDAGANNVYNVTVQVSDGSLNDTQAISVTVTNSTTGDVLVATQDTYIKSVSPTLNYGQSTSLIVDKSTGGIGASRALLLFDLADIPANVTITNAMLVMQSTQNSGPFDVNIYQVTQAWQEGSGNGSAGAANWTQRQTGVNWSATGGAYANTIIATLNTAATGQHTWNVTSLVADWYAANKVNYGMIIGSPNLGTGTVTYDSAEGAIAPQLLVTFDANNAPPVITSNGGGATGTVNVAENTTSVTTVAATDVNLPGQTLTYSISGGADAAKFVINSSTGVLTFAAAQNYESPTDVGTNNIYDVIVQVSDGIVTDTQAIAVTVTPVNDNAPVITSNSGGASAAISVAENSATVTTITATDADLPTQTLTYSISGGADAARFAINSSTGVLTFATTPDYELPDDNGANNVYDVTIQVTDGTLTDTQSITVTVTAMNDNTPVITSGNGGASATISVVENDTAVTTVAASDVDLPAQTLTYSISGGADASKFAINSATGVLSFVEAPDFESPTDSGADNVYDVTVQATDGTLTDTQAIAVTVIAVNDNSPVITSNGGGASTTISINENATAVTTMTASDIDLPTQTLTYSISGGADATKFAINNATGVLTFATAPDFELPRDSGANNVYDVIVQVTDGTTADTQAIAVSVSNVNDNTPVVTTGQSFSVSEVAPVGTSLGAVVASDADAGTTFSNWTITGGNNAGIFAINASTGALTVANNAALDYETTTSYSLTVRVSDGVKTSQSKTVSINVTPVNDNNPVITSSGGGPTATVSVAENTTEVATIAATDADLPAQTLTYSITGGADATKFAINSSTGVLSFVAAPDYEIPVDSGSNNVYDVIVRVSDGTWVDMQAIAVTVTPLNDNNPLIMSNGGGATASIDIAENLTAVTTVFATDADQPAQSLTYSIIGGVDAAKFTINSTTGVLSLLTAPDFENPTDAGSNNSYRVTVRVSDDTSSDTQSISVRVIDINEAPTANAGGPYAISEGGALTVVAGLSVDPEGQPLTYAWDIDGDGLFTDATGSTATLTWSQLNSLASPVNDNGTRAMTLRVTDAGGISTVATTTLTVTNTAPTVNVTGNATTSSGTPYVINFSSTDPGADTIATYRVNWGDGTTESVSGTAASATHTYLIPGGTRSISVIAIDEDGTFPMNGGPLVVTVLNTAPSIPTLSDSVVPGLTNGAVVGTLNFTDPDSGDAHTWTVSDSRFTVVGSILKLKSGLQLNPVTEPTVALTVTVTDASGASGTANFTLRVNNPPVSARDAYAVDGTQQLSISSPSLGVLANDIDADGDAFSASLISGPSHAATFGLNADGTFWYRAAAGYSGVDTFLYRVNDGENLGAVTTVTLTVNQPASLTYTSLVSIVPEKQTLSTPLKVGTFTIVDDGIGTNTLTLTGTDAALFALDNNHNLFLKAGLTVDYAVQTRFDVTVLLDDLAIAGTPDASRSLVINVLDINAAPVASALPNVIVLEDASPGTISTASAFFDSDGDALNYAVQVVSQTPGLIKTININQATGSISYSLNANAFGTATVRVTGSDLLNARASAEFQLIVQSVNDAPVAVGYSGSTLRGQTLTSAATGVLSSVSDVELDLLTVTLVSGPANGTVVLQANGSFVYTPSAGFQGTDTFSFVASDGIVLSNVGTATISVLPQFIGQQPGSSSGTSGTGTPASTGTGGTSGTSGTSGTTGSTSTGSGTAGNSGTGNSGATNSQSGSGSGSSAGATTGVTTVSPPSGVLNPTVSGTESETKDNDNKSLIGFLQMVEDVSTNRILVSASQNSFESQHRNSSNDFMRRTNEAFASHNFDAMFNQSDSTPEMSSLNTEREALYKQLAGRVDQQSDAVAEQLEKSQKLKGRVVGSVGVVTTGFSVGYLFWAVRLGTLASGLLAQVPAWSMLDPLLVIDGDQKEEEDKESLQNIIDRQQARVNKAHETTEPDPNAHT